MPDQQPSNLFDASSSDHEALVSALRPLPSNPNIVSVRVGRRSVAKVRASVAEELGIVPGTPWTETLAEAVERWHRFERARTDALRLLGRRDLTGVELRERLGRKTHEPDAIDSALEALQTEGWIDEAALAARYLAYLTRDRPASATLLRARLEARGVSPEIAEQALATALGEIDPVDAAEALARTRLPGLSRHTPATQARRLGGVLGRRGFDLETITEVLRRLKLLEGETPD